MKSPAITFLTIILIMHAMTSHALENAGDIAADCAKVISGDEHEAGDKAFFVPSFETGQCWGAFASVQQLGAVQENADDPPLLGFCVPEDLRRTQIILVFLHYLKGHPSQMTTSFGVVVVHALRAAYPCRKK